MREGEEGKMGKIQDEAGMGRDKGRERTRGRGEREREANEGIKDAAKTREGGRGKEKETEKAIMRVRNRQTKVLNDTRREI